MSFDLRYQPRPTRKLSEITGSDMLSAVEKLINGEIGGYYSIGDEQAYFRLKEDKPQLTIRQFEAKLQELHPYFCCIFNATITPKHISKGHQVGFFVPEVNGFVPLCCVGHAGDNILNANSEGSIAKYIGKKSLREKEQAILSRGYVAAMEFAKLFLNDVKETGTINPNKIMDAKEWLVAKARVQTLGGQAYNAKMFEQARIVMDKEYDNQQAILKIAAEKSKIERENLVKELAGV